MYKFNFYHTGPENFFHNANESQIKGLVGHLRGDFGRDGKEFHHSWFNFMHIKIWTTFRCCRFETLRL